MRRARSDLTGLLPPTATLAAVPVALAIVAMDTVLIAALAVGWLDASVAAVAHLGLAGLAGAGIGRRGCDRGFALLFAMAVIALGPIGAIASLLNRLLIRPKPAAELEDWYRTIVDRPVLDEAEALYQQISDGRAYAPAQPPRSFFHVMEEGNVEQRQRLLGVLVQHASGAVEPLLRKGLAARELAVRAPAAAVMARLREGEGGSAGGAPRP